MVDREKITQNIYYTENVYGQRVYDIELMLEEFKEKLSDLEFAQDESIREKNYDHALDNMSGDSMDYTHSEHIEGGIVTLDNDK